MPARGEQKEFSFTFLLMHVIVLDGSSVGFIETIEKDLAQLHEQVLMHKLHLVVEGCMLSWTAMRYTLILLFSFVMCNFVLYFS